MRGNRTRDGLLQAAPPRDHPSSSGMHVPFPMMDIRLIGPTCARTLLAEYAGSFSTKDLPYLVHDMVGKNAFLPATVSAYPDDLREAFTVIRQRLLYP